MSGIIKCDPADLEGQEEARAIVFQHGIMCQVSLPRSRQLGRTFARSFKNASILIEAGSLYNGKEWEEQPIPYGAKPRLALLYINSEAIKTQSAEIDIGRSYADFCARLGLSKGGKAFYELKKQMNALAACKMSFGFVNPNGQAVTLKDVEPIDCFQAWMVKDDKQLALWPATLSLGPKYMASLLEHAVPLPFEAMAALRDSAMSLDLLSFFARRLHSLERPVRVPFVLFKEQFGQEYIGKNQKDDFRKEFLKAVKEVKEVYPRAIIEQVKGGLLLKPSAPLVNGTPYQQKLPFQTAPLVTAGSSNLKDATIEDFRAVCPRLDVYACKADFDAWLEGKEPPRDYQKAFIGFAKKWGKGKG